MIQTGVACLLSSGHLFPTAQDSAHFLPSKQDLMLWAFWICYVGTTHSLYWL